MAKRSRAFISAEWHDLVMLNYEIDPKLLSDYVPPGTSLDSFNEKTYVSLVGFQFRGTKVFGVPVPFHSDFDEVNLRLYVHRNEGAEDRRGVAFIAEVVPKRLIAHVARFMYGENYTCLPMKHAISADTASRTAEYALRLNGAWCRLYAQASAASLPPANGTLEQFITEHYWGYCAQRNGTSLEYHVSHLPWSVRRCEAAGFEGDARALYGYELGNILHRPPHSAFIADGSPVNVFAGKRIQ
jgi:uncharacterized protein